LAERISARNYSENLSIKWKGVWKTDASQHKVVCGFVQAEKNEPMTLHRFMKSMLFSFSFFSFFLFYRDSTLLTPQAQSARRDSSSVVRFATPVTILRGDKVWPRVRLHMQHTHTYTNARPHVRSDSRYRERDTCRRHDKALPTKSRASVARLREQAYTT